MEGAAAACFASEVEVISLDLVARSAYEARSDLGVEDKLSVLVDAIAVCAACTAQFSQGQPMAENHSLP